MAPLHTYLHTSAVAVRLRASTRVSRGRRRSHHTYYGSMCHSYEGVGITFFLVFFFYPNAVFDIGVLATALLSSRSEATCDWRGVSPTHPCSIRSRNKRNVNVEFWKIVCQLLGKPSTSTSFTGHDKKRGIPAARALSGPQRIMRGTTSSVVRRIRRIRQIR